MNEEKLEDVKFEDHPQAIIEATPDLEQPGKFTPSKKQRLMKELKEYGISRSEWKSYLRKNGVNKSSIGTQLDYCEFVANQIIEQKKSKTNRDFDLVVSVKKDPLKKLRDELLLELGISTRKFKSMIPKVINKSNGTWDVATKEDLARRLGAKMSMRQQVVWLQELLDATKEIRESFKETAQKDGEMEKIEVDPVLVPSVFTEEKTSAPTFSTGE